MDSRCTFIAVIIGPVASSTAVAAMAGTEQSMGDFGVFYDTIRDGFWGLAAAARVTVWGLPMMVLAIISAVTQPAQH